MPHLFQWPTYGDWGTLEPHDVGQVLNNINAAGKILPTGIYVKRDFDIEMASYLSLKAMQRLNPKGQFISLLPKKKKLSCVVLKFPTQPTTTCVADVIEAMEADRARDPAKPLPPSKDDPLKGAFPGEPRANIYNLPKLDPSGMRLGAPHYKGYPYGEFKS